VFSQSAAGATRGRLLTASASAAALVTREEVITDHPSNNISDIIFQKIGTNLHQRPDHPLGIIKSAIADYFEIERPGVFKTFDDMYPVVSAKAVSTLPCLLMRESLPACPDHSSSLLQALSLLLVATSPRHISTVALNVGEPG